MWMERGAWRKISDKLGNKFKWKRKRETIKIERSTWTEEEINYYHKKCEDWPCIQTEIEDIWKEMEEKVKDSIKTKKGGISMEDREKKMA